MSGRPPRRASGHPPPGDPPLGDHHDDRQDAEREAQRHGDGGVEQVVGVDRPGQGVVAQQLHGAEVGDDVEEDQERPRGDRGARLGQHHRREGRGRPAAEQAGRLLHRRRQLVQAGGHRQVDVGVGEQGQHREGPGEAADLGQPRHPDGLEEALEQPPGREGGDEGEGPDERGQHQRQGQQQPDDAPPRQVRAHHQPGRQGADDRRRGGHGRGQQQAAAEGGEQRVVGQRRPDASLLGVADDQVGQRRREGHRQHHHQGAQAEPARPGAVAHRCGDGGAHSNPLSWISRAVPSMSPSRAGSSSGGRSDSSGGTPSAGGTSCASGYSKVSAAKYS